MAGLSAEETWRLITSCLITGYCTSGGYGKSPMDGQEYDPHTRQNAGESGEQERFISGLFDKNSWKQYLPGWAKTVFIGRALLCGVSAGMVAV